MDNDVDAAHPLAHGFGQDRAVFRPREVRGDELRGSQGFGPGPGGRQDLGAELLEQGHRGGARTAGAGGDQRALACKSDERDHGMTSSSEIFSRSRTKKKRTSTGLPGKSPARWLATTIRPASSAIE